MTLEEIQRTHERLSPREQKELVALVRRLTDPLEGRLAEPPPPAYAVSPTFIAVQQAVEQLARPEQIALREWMDRQHERERLEELLMAGAQYPVWSTITGPESAFALMQFIREETGRP